MGAPGSGKSTFCDLVMRVSTRPWVRICQVSSYLLVLTVVFFLCMYVAKMCLYDGMAEWGPLTMMFYCPKKVAVTILLLGCRTIFPLAMMFSNILNVSRYKKL